MVEVLTAPGAGLPEQQRLPGFSFKILQYPQGLAVVFDSPGAYFPAIL